MVYATVNCAAYLGVIPLGGMMEDKARKIIRDLLVAIDTITYQDDSGIRENAFQPGVDLNKYIGNEIEEANKYLKETKRA